MAYGKAATGHDASRNRQYPDVAGSRQSAEGAVDISGTLLQGVNREGFGPSKVKQAQVADPSFQSSPPNHQPGNLYPFASDGEPGRLGEDSDDYTSTLRDSEYPTVPSPEFAGESGTRNRGPQGDTIDFNSVAPYEYPDFGDWPNSGSADPTARLAQ